MESVNRKRCAENKPVISKTKFKLLCETRWVERHTAMEDFHHLYEPLVLCLSQISNPPRLAAEDQVKWDAKSTTEASGLLKDIQSSEFLVSFYTCRYLFGFTKDIANQLQGESKDVLSVYEDMSGIISCVTAARTDGETRFRAIFHEANTASELSREELTVPRRCATQTSRSNHPSDSPEEFWRRSVYIPFADHLVGELKSRFNQLSTTALQGLCLLPENAVMPNAIPVNTVAELQKVFSSDLPAADSLQQEVERWVMRWQNTENLPQSLSDTYRATNCHLYPNISCILHLLLVAPVTSASVERANSSLDYVKTELRSTMSQNRLNDLILLYIHKDIPLQYSDIVDRFAVRAPRRMQLIDPMHHPNDED